MSCPDDRWWIALRNNQDFPAPDKMRRITHDTGIRESEDEKNEDDEDESPMSNEMATGTQDFRGTEDDDVEEELNKGDAEDAMVEDADADAWPTTPTPSNSPRHGDDKGRGYDGSDEKCTDEDSSTASLNRRKRKHRSFDVKIQRSNQ